MTIRFAAALLPFLVSAGAAPVAVAEEIEPRAGIALTGDIRFPRAQGMTIQTDPRDGSKLKVHMGFHGRCKGGGVGEVWSANVLARPAVRVRDGRIEAELTSTVRNFGDVRGRTGEFSWKLAGRFVQDDVVRATVTGSAVLRVRVGRVISRCRIAAPASARLAMRS
jgi:hypothetical protein